MPSVRGLAGPVFRAENSNTHRHLCEFVGLDLEMEIQDSYLEAVDVIDELLKYIFREIQSKCSKVSSRLKTATATGFSFSLRREADGVLR